MATGQLEESKRELIVVSNRLPLSVKKEHGKITTTVSSGGLVTALSGLAAKVDFRWMGWPAVTFEDAQEQHAAEVSLSEKGSLGIFLDAELADLHYNGFSNAILWPILHYQSGVNFEDEPWQAYQRVNEIFADRVAKEARDGHLIWVHDYHLMLLPGLLRARLAQQGKRCAIGFTFHTPFPAPDFWRAIPVAEELLRGVLGSNVVGFHTDDYKHNFKDACERILQVEIHNEAGGDEISYNSHRVRIDSFVIGINPQKFDDALKAPDVIHKIQELEQTYQDKMVIVGVDRLDHAKGLVQKLAGYELLLQEHPELQKKITLIQVVVPSREDVKEYQELETELETLVGRISGAHNSLDAVPLIYIHGSVSFSELTALYSVADVCLIASRRDGMNLVASEFIACQGDRHGVLVLSELAGTAHFLHQGSILFHPSSASDIAHAIYQAINMSQEERGKRYLTLREFIDTHTSMKWGETFLSALSASIEQQ